MRDQRIYPQMEVTFTILNEQLDIAFGHNP